MIFKLNKKSRISQKIKKKIALFFVVFQKERLTPISSTSILSNPTGPKEVFTILAIDWAAMTINIVIKYKELGRTVQEIEQEKGKVSGVKQLWGRNDAKHEEDAISSTAKRHRLHKNNKYTAWMQDDT